MNTLYEAFASILKVMLWLIDIHSGLPIIIGLVLFIIAALLRKAVEYVNGSNKK